jgi:hypothetical protein
MKINKTLSAKPLKSILIAPCGMNCGLCHAYMRDKNTCPGCRGNDELKSKSVTACHIKNCRLLKAKNIKFCFQCQQYPCHRIKHIDKRYRTKYAMSMMDNLEYVKRHGIRKFVRKEKEQWTCANCGKTICVHKKCCICCGCGFLEHSLSKSGLT